MLALLSADPSLGRIDYNSLSDQTLMEILFDGLDAESKAMNQDESGSYLNIAEWNGLFCDSESRVLVINKPHDRSNGSIPLEFIPPMVENYEMNNMEATGTLDTCRLPKRLRFFSIAYNAYFGTVNFQTIPERVTNFEINDNAFSGTCDLTSLPQTLLVLCINRNKFCGGLAMDNLPPRIESLLANENQFTGTVCLSNLPRAMFEINISDNALEGQFILTNEPPSLFEFNAVNKKFCGKYYLNKS